MEKGFYYACTDIKATRYFVVYPGTDRSLVSQDTEVIGLAKMVQEARN